MPIFGLLALTFGITVISGSIGTSANTLQEEPLLEQRTPIPGADQGGTFADGVTADIIDDREDWLKYENNQYGYSFNYPKEWLFDEQNNGDLKGPNGEPYYPLNQVSVKLPISARGENIQGENCSEASCQGLPPNMLGFYVSILDSGCDIPGKLVVSDVRDIAGRQVDRCIIESPDDDATRILYLSFPLQGSTDVLVVALERGRDASPDEQRTLDTILATFEFDEGNVR